MPETRGYETIVDRTDGWGPGVVAEDQPDADAAKEVVATRVTRVLGARKQGTPGDTPDTDDRTRGYGGTFDPSDGADGGYDVKDWESSDEDLGVDYDVEYTGSNTARTATDTEASISVRSGLTTTAGRTVDTRATVLISDDTLDASGVIDDNGAARRAEVQRTSIVDRTDGWGHGDGNSAYRRDS